MASAAMILGLATADSLIIIDELGRGTSPSEGIGISHAIAESLIGIKVGVRQTIRLLLLNELIRHSLFLQRKSALVECWYLPKPCRHFHDLTTTLSKHPAVVQ
jgi:hypothetical protein